VVEEASQNLAPRLAHVALFRARGSVVLLVEEAVVGGMMLEVAKEL